MHAATVLKHHDQSNQGRKGLLKLKVHSSSWKVEAELRAGTEAAEANGGAEERGFLVCNSGLAQPAFLMLKQNHLPRDGTHSELGPSMSIINQDNDYLQAGLMDGHSLNSRPLFLDN